MDAKVQELIEKRIEELKAQKEHKRKEHLIKLGLTSEDNERRVANWQEKGAVWDDETRQYYIIKPRPIEVTDDEYSEICKYYPEPEKESQSTDVQFDDYGAENTLKIIAVIVLIVGILGSIILFMQQIVGEIEGGVAGAIALFLGSLISWALMKCISNISRTLKEIKGKIK